MRFRPFIAVVALTVVVAMSGVLAAQFGPPPKLYTPEPGAKDMKAVLFNWTWHMGMLRGVSEPEIVATLEYQGKGTIQVNGQPCTLTKYRVSTNYQTPGQRTQIECSQSNGQKVLGHRNGERGVLLERRHPRRRDRCRQGEGDADARDSPGTADSTVG